MSESGNDIFLSCLNLIAISLISLLYGSKMQSSRRAWDITISFLDIPFIPSSSISLTKDTASNFSVYTASLRSPSRRLIKMLVSARKSIFTSCLLLIGQPIKPTFKRPEVFFERDLSSRVKLGKRLFDFRLCGSFLYRDYHRQI